MKLLKDCLFTEIQEEAKKMGYVFSVEDCQELVKDSYEGETLSEALNDYLDAYER